MKIEEVNFRTLTGTYESRGAVREAREITVRYTPKRLTTLLRHHRDGTVEGRDVERRAAFDELLEYYSLMEVACIAGYVPKKLPEDYTAAALAALSKEQVAAYYETKYPLLLPLLHRERLRGRWTARERGADLPARFMAFTELNKVLDDEDVDVFLWFLEDGSVDEVSIGDLLAIIADPAAFGAALAGDPDETDPAESMNWEAIEQEALADPGAMLARLRAKSRPEPEASPAQAALRGFRKFLFFARDLDTLLSSMDDTPLTRSAMWHHHSYWFDELGHELRPYLHGAIDRFLSWDAEAAESRSRIAAEMHDCVRRLTSDAYALALREARAKALAPRRVVRMPTLPAFARFATNVVLGGAAALAASRVKGMRDSSVKSAAASGKAASAAKKKSAAAARPAAARPAAAQRSSQKARIERASPAKKSSKKAAKSGRKRVVAKAAKRVGRKAAKAGGGRKSAKRTTRRA